MILIASSFIDGQPPKISCPNPYSLKASLSIGDLYVGISGTVLRYQNATLMIGVS